MTYEEFKEQGYSIESVHYATVWSEVTIDETAEQPRNRYDYEQIDTNVDGVDFYRIVPAGNNDEHAYEEFSDMEEVEEYIRYEM